MYVPCHKKKKLYASLVFEALNIQLRDSSIEIVSLASKDREILSWIVTLLKKTSKKSPENKKGQTFNTCVKNWNKQNNEGNIKLIKHERATYTIPFFASFYSFRLSIWCCWLWNNVITLSFFLFFCLRWDSYFVIVVSNRKRFHGSSALFWGN